MVTAPVPGQAAYEAGPLGWVGRGIWPPVPWEELTPQDHAWWDKVARANDPWPDWALLAGARQEAAALRAALERLASEDWLGTEGYDGDELQRRAEFARDKLAAVAAQEAHAAPELATLRVLRAVAGHFTDTWAELMTALPGDYGCEMTCGEANAAADLYRALGLDVTAGAITAAHIAHDDDDERAAHREDGGQ